MLNAIWLGLLLIGVVVAAANGRIEVVTQAALASAQGAVEVCFGLIGTMALWLGLLRVAEKAGLVKMVARLLEPVTVLLYPSIPRGHPALGAIIMNLSANVLGLGNAATPFGLRAMKELQELNKGSETASDAMCTFLAMNTSCITLIPATILGVRVANGSTGPTDIVGPTIFATCCATLVALTGDAVMRGVYYRRRRKEEC